MKKVLILALCVAFSFAGFTQTTSKIDLEASTIEWTGKKVTGQHTGNLNFNSGSLEFLEGELVGGSFEVDMTSLTVTDIEGEYADKLKGHLMSDDFFSTDAHKTATLTFTEVAKADGNYVVVADLTIKGITKPIKFELNLSDGIAKTDLVVDRTLYDIKYGSGSFFDNLGDKTIYDDFDLVVSLAY